MRLVGMVQIFSRHVAPESPFFVSCRYNLFPPPWKWPASIFFPLGRASVTVCSPLVSYGVPSSLGAKSFFFFLGPRPDARFCGSAVIYEQ